MSKHNLPKIEKIHIDDFLSEPSDEEKVLATKQNEVIDRQDKIIEILNSKLNG